MASIVAIGVQSLIELGIVAVILIAIGNVGWTWLVVPVWLALLFTFVASTTYALSVLNVFFRDVAQLVAVGLQLIFFLTPIIYPLTLIPAEWHGLPTARTARVEPVHPVRGVRAGVAVRVADARSRAARAHPGMDPGRVGRGTVRGCASRSGCERVHLTPVSLQWSRRRTHHREVS